MSERGRIHRGGDHGANLAGQEQLHLLDHLGGIIIGDGTAVLEPAILGGRGQAMIDTLHELALVVLCKGQDLAEVGRRRACGRIGIEWREDRGCGEARRAVLRRR